MNSLTLLLVCVQVCLIQYTCGQYYEQGYTAPAPPCAAPLPVPAPAYGIRVSGNALTIDGQAQITGSAPFASSVQLDGEVDAEGTAHLKNACNCGDAYLQ